VARPPDCDISWTGSAAAASVRSRSICANSAAVSELAGRSVAACGAGDERDLRAVQRGELEVRHGAQELRLADEPAALGRVHVDARHVGRDLVRPPDELERVVPDLAVHLEVVARGELELDERLQLGPRAGARADVGADVVGEGPPALPGAEAQQRVVGRRDAGLRVGGAAPERLRAGRVRVGDVDVVLAGRGAEPGADEGGAEGGTTAGRRQEGAESHGSWSVGCPGGRRRAQKRTSTPKVIVRGLG
jgi:hypothetical protein